MKSERGIGLLALIFSIVIIGAFLAFSLYLIRLDNIIRDKFEGQRWDIPAKVFSRPLEVYTNAPVNQTDFTQELKLLGYKQSDSYTKSGSYVTSGSELYVHTRGFDFGDSVEPEQVLKVNFSNYQIAEVSATKPSATGIARLEPLLIGGIYPQHNEDRVLIKLNKVPKPLIEALIATEDRNFYQHYGVSIRGTARAIVSNVTGGKRQGGSTLTQQLVKNFYLSPERTLKRKANEALMAMLMSMAQLFLRKSSTWVFGIWFCLYYEAVLLWQMPVAWFTFWKDTWGTRMTPADVREAEKKKKKEMKKHHKAEQKAGEKP